MLGVILSEANKLKLASGTEGNDKTVQSVFLAGEPLKAFKEFDTSDNSISKVNTLDSRELFKPVQNYNDPAKELTRKRIPQAFYNSSSLFHFVNAVFGKIMPKTLKAQLDRTSVNFSKLGHSLIQLDLAKESLDNNRSLDFMAKIAETFLTALVDLEDIPLVKGVSGALNMFDYAQAGRVGNKQANLVKNFKANLQEQKRMLHDVIAPGGIKHLFQSRDKEKGHTIAFSGYIMLLGSLIGVPFGLGKRNAANKLGSVIKNAGALLSNFSMWNHPNSNLSKAGKIYSVDAVLDSLQRFMEKDKARPLNHLVMAVNQIASYFYGLSSRNLNEANTKLYA